MQGLDAAGVLSRVQVMASHSAVNNYGFDVTPARLVTALITEHGIVGADPVSLRSLRERLGR